MRSFYIIILSLAGSLTITYLVSAYKSVSASYLGIFSLILMIALCSLYRRTLESRNNWKKYLILSSLLSISTVGGIFIDSDGSLENFEIVQLIKFNILCACLIPAFYCLLQSLSEIITWMAAKDIKFRIVRAPINRFWHWLLIMTGILLCWTPVWLAYYPGIWNYDAGQVWQVVNGKYEAEHPIIHTLIMGSCFNIGYLKGNSNLGVVIYDWVQMIILASILSYSILFIRRKSQNNVLCFLTFIFYSLFPINSVLAISSTKDILFSALVLLYTMLSVQYSDCVRNEENKKHRTRLTIGLLITTTVMLLFRNNASYAFAGFLCIALIFTLRRKISWKTFVLILACMLLYIGCNTGLLLGLHAKKSSITEALSVPAQQFGRIYYSGKADEATKELIGEYCDPKTMSYDPHLSDSMKSRQSLYRINTWKDVAPLIGTSLQLFIRYPAISIDSFLYLTEGWWYLGDTSCANIYGYVPGSHLGYFETGVMDGFGIIQDSKLPGLETLFEHAFIENSYQQWPLLSLLFAPALYIWLFVFLFISLKGDDKFLFIFHCFFLATVLLGPCCLVRYVYPFVLMIPVMLVLVVSERKLTVAS